MLDPARAAGVRLAIDLRVRGVPSVVARIEDGTLRLEESHGQPVDCHLAVDPVAYLLLTWNRINPVAAILRGQMLPWGRRPWRVATFGSLLST